MITWRLVRFEPWDILVNADARGLGEGGYGFEGEIAPAAFAGAIRTLVLRHNGYDFTKPSSAQDPAAIKAAQEVGLDGGDFPFRFAGPFLCARGLLGWDLYFTAPAHLLHAPQSEQVPAGWLVPKESAKTKADGGLTGSCLLSICPAPSYELEQAEALEGWARACDLQKILLADLGQMKELSSARDFYVSERKEGHTRSERGTVEEGQLFSRGALRFQDEDSRHRPANPCFAGLISVDEDFLGNGTYDIRLAGDGRPVRLRVEPAGQALAPLLRDHQALASKIGTTKRFLLYLATPAIFEQGWQAKDWAAALGTPSCIKLALAGACVSRPRILGGWDLKVKARRAKPVRRAAPAGSVYFFTYEGDWNATGIEEWLNGLALQRPLSNEDGPLGYGWALAGLWPEVGCENGGQ